MTSASNGVAQCVGEHCNSQVNYMSTTTKKRAGGAAVATTRRPRARTTKQFEAYLLSRELLRNLQRSAPLFPHEERVHRSH